MCFKDFSKEKLGKDLDRQYGEVILCPQACFSVLLGGGGWARKNNIPDENFLTGCSEKVQCMKSALLQQGNYPISVINDTEPAGMFPTEWIFLLSDKVIKSPSFVRQFACDKDIPFLFQASFSLFVWVASSNFWYHLPSANALLEFQSALLTGQEISKLLQIMSNADPFFHLHHFVFITYSSSPDTYLVPTHPAFQDGLILWHGFCNTVIGRCVSLLILSWFDQIDRGLAHEHID